MKDKRSSPAFVLSMAEGVLTLVKVQAKGREKWSVLLAAAPAEAGSDEKSVAVQLKGLLAKMGYKGSRLVLALPRDQVTCRQVKMPSTSEDEITKMVALQSCQYLPYQAEDLVTGFEMLRVDESGFTHTNLIILHKALIERSIRIMKEAGAGDFVITLSSVGLSGLYGALAGAKEGAVMAVGFNTRQVEVSVIAGQKTVFSRSFMADLNAPEGEELFYQQMRKTLSAYQKEAGVVPLTKIVLLAERADVHPLSSRLFQDLALPVETLPYSGKVEIKHLAEAAQGHAHSGAALSTLIGLGLRAFPASLNLIPSSLKASWRQARERRDALSAAVLFLGAAVLLGAGMWRDLDNKSKYLQQLRLKWQQVAAEIKPLELADRRFKAAQVRAGKQLTGAQALLELYKVMPEGTSLAGFGYEEGGRITLRGQAKDLDGVFAFVAALRGSSVFKDLGVDVRYATQRKTLHEQVADFEIVCGSAAGKGQYVPTAQ
jgi:Tfp pilus assembly PilM family ATPase/Tfp pilus assembly protein PilN